MENFFAGVDFGGRQTKAVDEAQQVMYDAWEAPTRKQAVALAKKALTISADCADAYNFLANEATKSLEEAIELFTKGVEAGKRAIGTNAFEENIGYFWGLLETRPYMRARAWRSVFGPPAIAMRRCRTFPGYTATQSEQLCLLPFLHRKLVTFFHSGNTFPYQRFLTFRLKSSILTYIQLVTYYSHILHGFCSVNVHLKTTLSRAKTKRTRATRWNKMLLHCRLERK
jgi:hypothetical protein